MATTYKDFSAKKGIIAEGGDVQVKAGYAIDLQNTSGDGVKVKAPSSVTSEYTLTLPSAVGNNGEVLKTDASGNLSWQSLANLGAGTVTSVGLSVPTGLAVSGSPVTSSGTLAVALDTGYVIPTQADIDAKLESSDIADKIELTNLSVTTAAAGTAGLSYNNTSGAFTFTPPDLSSYLTSETTTTLALSSNTLTYTDETGATTNIDLSAYLDEDARAISSGTLNGATGIVTFTRDDATTFTLDLSDLLDDTNLVTSVNGSAGVVVLTADDIGDGSTYAIPTLTQESNWDTAYGWGNHASAGYLTSESNDLTSSVTWANVPNANITEGSVTQHEAALTITESQISDLGTYVESGSAATVSSLDLGSTAGFAANTTASATALETTAYDRSSYTGAKLVATLVNSSGDRQITEMLVTDDGTDVFITEYGTVFTGSDLVSGVSGIIAGNNVIVTVTTGSAMKISVQTTYL